MPPSQSLWSSALTTRLQWQVAMQKQDTVTGQQQFIGNPLKLGESRTLPVVALL